MATFYPYSPDPDNWYKQAPYTFRFNGKYFNLPISPSNLNITTHFATNVVATMYGTIEEHSEQRYFDISISGTTGVGPTYYQAESDSINVGYKKSARYGYTALSTVFGDNAGAPFARRTKDLINKALDQASEGFADINAPIKSGITSFASGYMAFHNFYKFLLDYKKKVANGQVSLSNPPLQFINYKDNNMYDVSVTSFQLMRDQRSPMLYNYNITLRAYNLRSPDVEGFTTQIDLEAVGLNGISTPAFAKLSNAARKAKNAAYALIAAAKGFGK